MPELAGQGAETARGRLARIGHHFLDGERAARVLALGAEPDRPDDLPPARLARALARLGVTVASLECDHCLTFYAAVPGGRSFRLEPRLAAERLKECWEACRSPTVLLGPADEAPVEPRTHLLMPVPADDAGMRRAYLRLKTLAASRPPTGVTIVGAGDRYQAEAAYERFAAAASRFLGLEVASYSYLLGGWSPEGHGDQEFDHIAALLLDDWRRESQTLTGDDAVPSPTTVASEETV